MVFWSQPFKIWLHQSWIKTFIIFVSISRPKVISHLDTFQILKEVPFSLTKSILFIGLKIESGRIRLKAWISFKQLLYTTQGPVVLLHWHPGGIWQHNKILTSDSFSVRWKMVGPNTLFRQHLSDLGPIYCMCSWYLEIYYEIWS